MNPRSYFAINCNIKWYDNYEYSLLRVFLRNRIITGMKFIKEKLLEKTENRIENYTENTM